MPKQLEGEEAIKGSFLQNEQKTSFKTSNFVDFTSEWRKPCYKGHGSMIFRFNLLEIAIELLAFTQAARDPPPTPFFLLFHVASSQPGSSAAYPNMVST